MAENPIFSYTYRDYENSRKEGLAKIPIISKGQWTDLNATDLGVVILDYVHALVDMINYYQDHQALEVFLSTARERENIFRIAKQLSYEIRSARGAVCNVEFTVSGNFDQTIKIPKYTTVATTSGIKYLTSQDAYLLPHTRRVSVPCTQGTLIKYEYKGTGISRFSNITGATNQSVKLIDNNIDTTSIIITDNIGRVWKSVDYIAFATDIDRAYQVDLNPDNSVTIRFGDGERGVVPRETDTLTIQYISTSAEEGRVSANSLVVLVDNIYDDSGKYVYFTVNNNKASTGGSSVQSSQEIKALAPGAIKAQNRAVTLNDFENLAKLVDGVSDAKAFDINTKPDLCLYHEVKVLVVPDDLETSTEILIDRVHKYLAERMMPPTNLQVLTPSYIDLDIEIEVKKLDTASEGRLSYEIQNVIETHFANRAGAVGEPFYPSDLLMDIRSINDIRNVISMTPNTTQTIEELSVFRLGTLNIIID